VVKIEQFGLKVGFDAPPAPSVDTGGGLAWAALAEQSARITDKISRMADRAAIREGEIAGMEHASEADLPPGAGVKPKTATAAPAPAPNDRQARAISFFMAKGYNKVQAAGIVGNLLAESSLRPDAKNPQDPGTSIGLAQWNMGRKAALVSFARTRGKDWTDFETQLEFVDHELSTTERVSGTALKQARTVDQAVSAMIGYERPAGWTPRNPRGGHGFDNRLRYAQAALDLDLTGITQVADAGNQPAPASLEAKAEPAAAGMVAHPAATQPFTLTRSPTLRGQAFDKSASEVYANRLETSTLIELERISQASPDDPAATAANIAEYRNQTRAQVPPEFRAGFDNLVARHELAYTRAASDKHAKDLANDAEASFLETYQAKRTALIRLAATAGTDDAGNGALAAELESLNDFVASSAELTPQQRVKLKTELTDDVLSSRLLAVFETRDTPDARQTFATFLGQAYNQDRGLGAGMSPEAFARVQAQMQTVIARDDTARIKQAASVDRRIDGSLAMVKAGYPIPEAERAALRAEVAATGDPDLALNYAVLENLATWQTANRVQPPQVIAAQIAGLKARIAKDGATPQDLVALDVMEGLHKSITDGLEKDPLGWAEQVGRVQVPAIDLSSPDAFRSSLTARADDAHAVAASYGRPVRFFKAAEAKAMSEAMAKNPDLLVTLGPSLRQALGDRDTPLALAEISKDAPVAAHSAGLAIATDDDGFLRETADALRLRQIEGHQPIKVPDSIRPPLTALRFLPGTEAAAVKSAELVFDVRARQAGLDPAADPAAAAELWGMTLSDALGRHTRNGVEMGGIAEINGSPTLIPPTISAEQLQDAMDGLTQAHLDLLPPIDAGGFEIGPDELSTGRLVAVGPNRYRLALGDPDSQDPRYVMAPGGTFWEFDPTQLTTPNFQGFPWRRTP
jgi:hypothetical protein